MEAILKTPAMHHISKDIFQFLDKTSLKNCREVNTSWKKALDQPQFWLKKLKEISTVQEFEIWKSVQKTKGYSKLNNPSSSRKQSCLAEKKPGQFAEMLRRKLELGLESISLWKKVQREPVLKSWEILAQKIVDYHGLALNNYHNNTLELDAILISISGMKLNDIRHDSKLWEITTTYSAYRGRCHTISYNSKVSR